MADAPTCSNTPVSASPTTRRTFLRSTAWAAPVVTMAAAAPAYAASPGSYRLLGAPAEITSEQCTVTTESVISVAAPDGKGLPAGSSVTLTLQGYTFVDALPHMQHLMLTSITQSSSTPSVISIHRIRFGSSISSGNLTVSVTVAGSLVLSHVIPIRTTPASMTVYSRTGDGTVTTLFSRLPGAVPLGGGLVRTTDGRISLNGSFLTLPSNNVVQAHRTQYQFPTGPFEKPTGWTYRDMTLVELTDSTGTLTHAATGGLQGPVNTTSDATRMVTTEVFLQDTTLKYRNAYSNVREIARQVTDVIVRRHGSGTTSAGNEQLSFLRNGVPATATPSAHYGADLFDSRFPSVVEYRDITGTAITPVGWEWFLSDTGLWHGNTLVLPGATSAHVSPNRRLTVVVGDLLTVYTTGTLGSRPTQLSQITVPPGTRVLAERTALSPDGVLWGASPNSSSDIVEIATGVLDAGAYEPHFMVTGIDTRPAVDWTSIVC